MSAKKKILIVDDEPDVVRWLKIMFENNGFEAISAVDGADGFEKATANQPDLIVLDISMPKESGVGMYRNLQKTDKVSHIPVIMLTGVSREFEKFISTRRTIKPPSAYFEKPVKEEELIGKVKELIG